MKKMGIIFPLIVSAFAGFIGLSNTQKNTFKLKTNADSIVVLELFTSQGCSSCPAADALVGEYRNNPSVIILSYHVDYWNRLGWVDSFSRPAYSQRQKDYSEQFNLDVIYTPQLVVNGSMEFLGSSREKIENAINSHSAKKVPMGITLNELDIRGDKLNLIFSTISGDNNSLYNVALIQNEATTLVRNGENKGVQLTQYAIVRDLVRKANLKNSSRINVALQLPKGFNPEDFSVVILEHNKKGIIESAIKKSLKK